MIYGVVEEARTVEVLHVDRRSDVYMAMKGVVTVPLTDPATANPGAG